LRSYFETASRRLKLENPMDDLDEVRFRQKAPTRLYLTKTEAGILFSAIERARPGAAGAGVGRKHRIRSTWTLGTASRRDSSKL
jgi:hypothetical protein